MNRVVHYKMISFGVYLGMEFGGTGNGIYTDVVVENPECDIIWGTYGDGVKFLTFFHLTSTRVR